MLPTHTYILRSKLILKNPDLEETGVFSVAVTHTDGVSASYEISKQGSISESSCIGIPQAVFSYLSVHLFLLFYRNGEDAGPEP